MNLDYQSIDHYISKLHTTISKSNYKFDCVIGVENGGLYISKPLANLLQSDHKSIKISFYGDGNVSRKKEPAIDYKDVKIEKNKRYLLVDDLIDSGATFDYFLKQHPDVKVMTAVVFWKRHNEYDVVPNFYAAIKPEGWINFPWEKST